MEELPGPESRRDRGNIVNEQTAEPRLGSHGVRMDIVLAADGRTYDVEMQTYRRGRVTKRLHYYQASLDVATLGKGGDYDRLPPTFIAFICTDDFLSTRLAASALESNEADARWPPSRNAS